MGRHGLEAESTRVRQRGALRNGFLVRYAITVLLNLIAQWAIFLGVLVYVVDRTGSRSIGLGAVALLLPYVLMAPVAGALAVRCAPQRIRLAGMAVQTVAWTIAAIAARAGLDAAIVIGAAIVGIGASPTLGPAGAVLRPAISRSANELTVANLWVGYARSLSILCGPLVTTGALLVGGPPAVIAACAAVAALGLVLSSVRRPVDLPSTRRGPGRHPAGSTLRQQLREVRRRPGTLGLVTAAGAPFFAVAAIDVVIVVAAEHELDLGPAGPGLLASAFGFGAFVAGAAATPLIRRARLAPMLSLAMLAAGCSAVLLGTTLSIAAAFVLLPVLGLAKSLHDLLGRLLLQRSADPDALGAVFAVLELSAGVGLVSGSVVAHVMISVAGVGAAFAGVGVCFLALLALSYRSVRRADDAADLPVVAMSLLRRVPLFSELPSTALERLARQTVEVAAAAGSTVITQGEPGDRFFAVADGRFDVTIAGRTVRTIERGGSFGEVALLADVPRTASVVTHSTGSLLAIDRSPFLQAVTGDAASRREAWGAVRGIVASAGPVRPDRNGTPVRP
ncbi:cyclic nucleotide-binding domain-containing protein [Ilumatobacter sp.]|uniref:cyclic nucleotide-binding domain-containing protein n=1 Tax=Ilumatobacter sp. TaxID=1967498 RepID=UPI003AF4D09D